MCSPTPVNGPTARWHSDILRRVRPIASRTSGLLKIWASLGIWYIVYPLNWMGAMHRHLSRRTADNDLISRPGVAAALGIAYTMLKLSPSKLRRMFGRDRRVRSTAGSSPVSDHRDLRSSGPILAMVQGVRRTPGLRGSPVRSERHDGQSGDVTEAPGGTASNKWCDAMPLRPLTRPTRTASTTGC